MPPVFHVGFFVVAGLWSLYSIVTDLRNGSTTNRNWTIEVKENPGGFYLIQFVKAAFVCLAIAVLLHAFGLTDDPYVWLKANAPWLRLR